MATARMDHTVTSISSNRVLAVGGGRTTTALSSAERFDPATGVWTSAGTVGGRYRHSATVVPGGSGNVLVAGGTNGTNKLNTTRLYNPTNNTWTNVGNMVVAQAARGRGSRALRARPGPVARPRIALRAGLRRHRAELDRALPSDAQPATGRQFHSAAVSTAPASWSLAATAARSTALPSADFYKHVRFEVSAPLPACEPLARSSRCSRATVS